jgi:hypothetical protein
MSLSTVDITSVTAEYMNDIDSTITLDTITTKQVVAVRDITQPSVPVDLMLGSTDSIHLLVGGMEAIDISRKSEADATTVFQSINSAPIEIQPSDSNKTVVLGGLTVEQYSNAQVLSSTQAEIKFIDNIRVVGSELVTGDFMASGSVLGHSMNIVRSFGGNTTVGFGFRVTNDSNLELYKYDDSVGVTKRIALFGVGALTGTSTTEAFPVYGSGCNLEIGGTLNFRESWVNDGSNILLLNPDARIGIGTNNPISTLHVTGTSTFSNVTVSGVLSGNGSQLTNLNASQLTTGILPVANGGTGVTTSSGTGSVVLNSNAILSNVTMAGTTSIAGHVIPTQNITFDLGSDTARFRDLWLSGNTIKLGNTSISSTNDSLSIRDSNNALKNIVAKEIRIGSEADPIIIKKDDATGSVSFKTSSDQVISAVPGLQSHSNTLHVGIGTTPHSNHRLDVLGSIRASTFHGDGSGITGTLTIDVDGLNVGIGTSSAQNINIGTASAVQTINLGTGTGATTINLGGPSDTVNIAGNLVYVQTTNMEVSDKHIVLNNGGGESSGAATGFYVEESGSNTGYILTSGSRDSWDFKAPATNGVVSIVPGGSNILISSSNIWTASGSNVVRSQGGVGIGTTAVDAGAIVQVGGGSRLRIAKTSNDYTVVGTNDVDGNEHTKIILSGANRSDAVNQKGWVQYYAGSNGNHVWYYNGSEKMRLNTAGNVGIGTNEPNSTLHVNGDLQINTLKMMGEIRTVNNSNCDFASMKYIYSSFNNNDSAPFSDTLMFNTWYNSNGGNQNMIMLNKTDIGMRLWQHNTSNTITNFSRYRDVITTNENSSNITLSGNIGIGTTNPNCPIDLGKQFLPRHISIYGSSNIYAYMGFGLASAAFTYNLDDSVSSHVFLAPNASMINSTYTVELMRIKGNGNVGIGTTEPSCPLDVVRTSNQSFAAGSGNYFNIYTTIGSNIGTSNLVSIKGADYMWATTGFVASSDNRIKTNIQQLEDNECLAHIRQIENVKYEYIDKISRGSNVVRGFIAQQVESVMPYAVSTQTEIIPSIYHLADVLTTEGITTITLQEGKTLPFSTHLTSDTRNEPPTEVLHEVRLILRVGGEKTVKVASVINETTFTIEEPLEESVTNIFAYGHRVYDFKVLNKQTIFTTTVGAVQELDRTVQSLQDENNQKTLQLQDQNARILALESALSSYEQRLSALEAASE